MPIRKLQTRESRSYGSIDPARNPRAASSIAKNITKKITWKKVIVGLFVLAALGFVGGTGVVLWISRDLPDPNNLAERPMEQSTKIYDRTGTHLLYEVYHNQKRTVVGLEKIASSTVNATVAIEDKNFYKHKGVRVTSILRATFNNLIGRRVGGGGASTLTQQLIKNTIVGDERRGFAGYFRKIKEAILALQLEKKYTKNEIVQMYLNEIPYGSTNYGVEAAAQSYFQKSAAELTLPESATLAALIQAPSRYLSDQKSLQQRRDWVLTLMQQQGYITEAQMKEAKDVPLRIFKSQGIFAAPHFVLYVKKLLADQFGENVVDTGGLKVVTSLDYDKQLSAEKIVKENGDKFEKTSNANNAALIAMDPKTGQILAMVGSRDFNNDEIDGQFNVAVLGRRQPGSSFKPFVYTAAFEKGYTPDTMLYDVKTDFDTRGGSKYTPKNYDGKERGPVTMRKALQGSLNIPAVKTMYLVGTKQTLEFAKRFGYTTFSEDAGLSLVLGGAEVSPLEHTNAYATLADNGVYHKPVSILSVTDGKGHSLFEAPSDPGTVAVAPEISATISNVLSDNKAREYIFGLRSTLVLPDRPAAAKTGTAQDNKDAWTLGYTPSLAVGVWVGNTIPSPMKSGGSALAGTIWNQFMQAALKDTAVEYFPDPPPNDAEKPVLRSSSADGGITLPINVTTGLIASSTTPPNLIVMKTFVPPHNILHYVNKDDPRGLPLANPADDPQYSSWEAGVQDWAARQVSAGKPVSFEDPPTDYDTVQNAEFAPSLTVTTPLPAQAINTRNLEVSAEAMAPRGVSQVVYMVDGVTLLTLTQPPFNATINLTSPPGAHTLKVIAMDGQGGNAIREIPFILNVAPDPATFDWKDSSPITINGSDYPRAMSVAPSRWDDTKDIKVYLSSPGGAEKLIYTFDHNDQLTDGKVSFTWKTNPGAGSYTLRGILTDKQGRMVEKRLEVVVN